MRARVSGGRFAWRDRAGDAAARGALNATALKVISYGIGGAEHVLAIAWVLGGRRRRLFAMLRTRSHALEADAREWRAARRP